MRSAYMRSCLYSYAVTLWMMIYEQCVHIRHDWCRFRCAPKSSFWLSLLPTPPHGLSCLYSKMQSLLLLQIQRPSVAYEIWRRVQSVLIASTTFRLFDMIFSSPNVLELQLLARSQPNLVWYRNSSPRILRNSREKRLKCGTFTQARAFRHLIFSNFV